MGFLLLLVFFLLLLLRLLLLPTSVLQLPANHERYSALSCFDSFSSLLFISLTLSRRVWGRGKVFIRLGKVFTWIWAQNAFESAKHSTCV